MSSSGWALPQKTRSKRHWPDPSAQDFLNKRAFPDPKGPFSVHPKQKTDTLSRPLRRSRPPSGNPARGAEYPADTLRFLQDDTLSPLFVCVPLKLAPFGSFPEFQHKYLADSFSFKSSIGGENENTIRLSKTDVSMGRKPSINPGSEHETSRKHFWSKKRRVNQRIYSNLG